MTSELENIKKGMVVSTVQFDTAKKIIGVATTNLQPGPDGIAPLEKQGAFQPAAPVETVDFAQALSSAQPQAQETIEENVVLPVLGTESTLKAPETSDVILENPVQVESPAGLSGFELPAIEVPEQPETPETNEPVALDIQLPEMPTAVVADAPTTLNENLFEGSTTQPESILTAETPKTETVVPIVENTPAATPATESTPVAETSLVVETTPATEAVPVTAEETPKINIELPTIESPQLETQTAVVKEQPQTQVELQTPVQETSADENIMNEIPTTTPANDIPEFNIELPVVGETAQKVETTPVVEETPANVSPETTTSEATPTVETQTITEIVEEQKSTEEPIENTAVESETLPQSETAAETESDEKEILNFKELMNQCKKIIIDCSNAMAKA